MKQFQIAILLIPLFINCIHGNPIGESLSNEIDIVMETLGLSGNTGIMDVIEILMKWRYDPNKLGLDPHEHIQSFGYPSEKHLVTTEDGYILTINRLPYGLLSKEKTNRPVVLLEPGMGCTPACFIDVGPKRALAFLLVELGFDVWIGSVRGSTFSRNHTTLDSMKSKKYWDFSWHEIGTIDFPTTIDYILNITGQRKLSYIGHSQGTTAFFVMAAEKPEYNDKINVMIALAPVAYMEHISRDSLCYNLANRRKEIFPLLKLLGLYNLFPHYDPVTVSIHHVCNDNVTDWTACADLVKLLIGYDPEMFDLHDVYVISSHYPGGVATKQLEHYAQLISDGGFKQFDYGKRKNQKRYGQPVPPAYNLTNIVMPVYLMYGDNDIFTSVKDLKRLHTSLTNSQLFRVDYDLFGHGDFLYAKKVIQLVYNYIFDILLKYAFV